MKVAQEDVQGIELSGSATNAEASLSPEVEGLLARLDALSEEERLAVLTGRTKHGSASDRLLKDIGRRMDRELLKLEEKARAAGDSAGNGWNRDERVGTTPKSQPGYRDFEQQAKLFTKALTLYSEDVATRAGAMLRGRGAFDVEASKDSNPKQASTGKPRTNAKAKKTKAEMARTALVERWVRLPLVERVKFVMMYSSVPGTSRHHWGTDVDVVEASSANWASDPRLIKLGSWLGSFAQKHGFTVAFNADQEGRGGGYQHEPWHLSDTELSRGMLARYHQTMFTGEKGEAVFKQVLADAARAVMRLQSGYHTLKDPPRQFDEAELITALLAADARKYIDGVDAQVRP